MMTPIGNREGKDMRKSIVTFAVLTAVFSMISCNKESITPDASHKTIITASTENGITKTALDGDDTAGYEVVWSAGDSFAIGTETFSLKEGEGTTSGVFEGTAPADGHYTVYYPSTYNGTDWPAAQTYVEGNIASSPMKAEVTVTGGAAPASIRFCNEGGILRLTVKNTSGAKIKNVIVTAEGLNPIVLNCINGGSGVALTSSGTVFHVAMPAGAYSNARIELTDLQNRVCTKSLKSEDLVITRSNITVAGFTADTFVASPLKSYSPVGTIGMTDGREGVVVDLGGTLGKVVVATMNIGAAGVLDEGNDECLGSYINYDDAVAAISAGTWGDGWYLPSFAEYNALKGQAAWDDSDETYGCVVNFPEAGTYLYLPPAGAIGTMGIVLHYWDQGFYWTSTPSSGTTAGPCYYTFCFMEGMLRFMTEGHDLGCSVRLFHKMPAE